MRTVALKEVCRITNGGTPKSGVESLWHGGVAWLTPAEMGKRLTPYVRQTARTISQEGLANSSAKLVPPGSVILSTRAPIGHLAINEAPMAFNQGCRGLTPGDNLDTSYLYYFLYFSRDALDDLGTGTTFKELSSSNLANFQIPLPPLDEQRRIVAVLDTAFAGIETATTNTQKNLTNARALFQNCLANVFDAHDSESTEVTLGSLVSIQGGFAFKSSEYVDSGHFLIRIGNVQDGHISLNNPKYVNLDKRTKPFELWAGDMLTSLTGNIGRVAVVQESDLPAALNQRVARLAMRSNAPVTSRYVRHFLASTLFRNTLSKAGHGTAQQNVSSNEIGQIRISYPPKSLQDISCDRLDQFSDEIESLISNYHNKLAALTELKQSLLQKAFAGELT